jgi:hypothetical protein
MMAVRGARRIARYAGRKLQRDDRAMQETG